MGHLHRIPRTSGTHYTLSAFTMTSVIGASDSNGASNSLPKCYSTEWYCRTALQVPGSGLKVLAWHGFSGCRLSWVGQLYDSALPLHAPTYGQTKSAQARTLTPSVTFPSNRLHTSEISDLTTVCLLSGNRKGRVQGAQKIPISECAGYLGL